MSPAEVSAEGKNQSHPVNGTFTKQHEHSNANFELEEVKGSHVGISSEEDDVTNGSINKTIP